MDYDSLGAFDPILPKMSVSRSICMTSQIALQGFYRLVPAFGSFKRKNYK